MTSALEEGVENRPSDQVLAEHLDRISLADVLVQVATAEVAYRQPDGSWRWIVDQPNVLGE